MALAARVEGESGSEVEPGHTRLTRVRKVYARRLAETFGQPDAPRGVMVRTERGSVQTQFAGAAWQRPIPGSSACS